MTTDKVVENGGKDKHGDVSGIGEWETVAIVGVVMYGNWDGKYKMAYQRGFIFNKNITMSIRD